MIRFIKSICPTAGGGGIDTPSAPGLQLAVMEKSGIEIRVKRLKEGARLPRKAHPGDLGYDLFSNETVTLLPGAIAPVPTGISVELPPGWGALVKDRSSMALKGITTRAGVIDGGYRGEILVVLKNEGTTPYGIARGDKIAQLVPHPGTEWTVTEIVDLSQTARGMGGFGSSESPRNQE